MPASLAPASSLSWFRRGWNSTWLVTIGASTIRDRVSHHGDGVVGDADILREPLVIGLLQQLQRWGDVASDRRPVKEEHVDIVDLQILQALLDRGDEPVFAEIVGMHLGGDAKVAARDPGGLERVAGVCLVSVHLRGVEGAVADLGRCLDRQPGLVPGQGKSAEGALVGLLEVDVHRGLPHRFPHL